MVDWSVAKKAFVLDNKGEQFKNSSYATFLKQAATFLQGSKYGDYGAMLLQYANSKFTKEAFGNRGGELLPLT